MVKYDTYEYTDEAEMIQSIEDSGYTIKLPIKQSGVLISTSSNLDYSYFPNPVSNYPVIEGEEWIPEFYSTVIINSARKGNSKLPSNKKLTGNDRKYFNNYINKFLGEEKIN